jgi:hypothetical protein
VEALIALVLFTMGVLAVAGVAAASLRSASAGARSGRAAWLALASAGELQRLAARGGSCAGFSAATRNAPGGTTLSWSFRPEAHGLAVVFVGTYPASGRSRSDTMWSFVPCR